jgi:hypothetical protein
VVAEATSPPAAAATRATSATEKAEAEQLAAQKVASAGVLKVKVVRMEGLKEDASTSWLGKTDPKVKMWLGNYANPTSGVC